MLHCLFDSWAQKKVFNINPKRSLLSYDNLLGVSILNKHNKNKFERIVLAFNTFEDFWNMVEKYWSDIGITCEAFKKSEEFKTLKKANNENITKQDLFDYAILEWLGKQLSNHYSTIILFNPIINDCFLEKLFSKRLKKEITFLDELCSENQTEKTFSKKQIIKVEAGNLIPRDGIIKDANFKNLTFVVEHWKNNKSDDKKVKAQKVSRDFIGKPIQAGDLVKYGFIVLEVTEPELTNCKVHNFISEELSKKIFADYNNSIYINLEEPETFKIWKKPLIKELLSKKKKIVLHQEGIPNE